MSDPTEITNILQLTLMGSTESISQAQRNLRNLSRNKGFLQNLLLIPFDTNIPYNIQKAAVIYTLTMARALIEEKNSEKLSQMAKLLLDYMFEQTLEITLLKHLSITVQTIMSLDREHVIRLSFQSNYVQALAASMNQPDQNVKFQFLGLCAQIFMGSTLHITKQFNQFIKNSLINFVNLSLRVMNHVTALTQTNNRQQIIRCFRILKIYSYALKLYLRKTLYADLQTIKLLYEDSLSDLLMMSLKLAVGQNELSSNIIFYQRNQDNDQTQLLHSIKADYVTAFSYMAKAIFQNFKDPKMILANKLLKQELIFSTIIATIKQLFIKCPYHKIKSRSSIKLIEEFYNLLIVCVRCNTFYNIFKNEKQNILNGCIFSTLSFSSIDYENFMYQPEEFINEILQVIDMDPHQYLKNRKEETSLDAEGYEEIENYNTLRTVTSTLLSSYCKNIDGTLPEIFDYAFKVFRSPEKINQIPKTLLLILLGILRDDAATRKDLVEEVALVLLQTITQKQIPKTTMISMEESGMQSQETSLEYIMLLIILYKYLPKTKGLQQKILPPLSNIIYNILIYNGCSDALKLMCYDLITVLALLDIDQESTMSKNFVKLTNRLLLEDYKNRQKILETMYNLYKYKDLEISKEPQLVIGTVQNLCQLIYKEVQQRQQSITKLTINKSWNIIQDICENELFIPTHISEIQSAVMPLIGFIDGKRQLDYEQNIFIMMTSFIRKSKTVTQNQLLMFDIVPKLFYNIYNQLFLTSFETLQVFILYGSNVLEAAPQAMEIIIDMCICSLEAIQVKKSGGQVCRHNEAENCQGILILQSLILSCGNSFSKQMWIKIAKAFTKRLENPAPTTNILKSTLVAGICVVVMVGFKAMTIDDSNILLNIVLQLYPCSMYQYPAKVLIVSLAQLISMPNLQFIHPRFTYILDTILSLLQLTDSKSFNAKKKPISDQQRTYNVMVSLVINKIVEMDELEYFKQKVRFIKANYLSILQQSVSELTEDKKKYLRELMKTSIVVGEKRKIFKIVKQ